MAGIVCARTLAQAGRRVTLFDKSRRPGGRMATRESPFGSFDHGAQYFTVRDKRFQQALDTVPGSHRPWSATSVRVLDPLGHVLEAGLPGGEPHWVGVPGMRSLPEAWAAGLDQDQVVYGQQVLRLARSSKRRGAWQLHTQDAEGAANAHTGFDAVVLALPAPQAQALLQGSDLSPWAEDLRGVRMDPCWTLMVAWPQAVQPGLVTLGPQWNVARSTHHRLAWMARESSKPGRGAIERWTLQASASWSVEHLQDTPERVSAKMLKAFGEVSGLRAEPAHVQAHRWLYAKTRDALGQTHLWHRDPGLGLCGDWCLGHRVENAFVSGLSMALAMIGRH